MNIEGQERYSVPWPVWSVTTRIDISGYRDSLWQAVTCHQTQIPEFEKLLALPQQDRERLWQYEDYYRVFSRVRVRVKLETDLFSGLYPSG